ncbi:MAG: hypothetical protein LAT67_02675 [Balneolales bacterium]|nr:hypothetical protein [Balneolales bacterium]
MNKHNKTNPTEDPEFGVDSRYRSEKERKSESIALMEARLKRMKNMSKDDILRAKLMQLKLRMEEFIKEPDYDDRKHFLTFLESYIDAIYSKRNQFASDIDITPVMLSQIINNHREPNDEFIKKIMIHSDKVFANICDFNGMTWYLVYFHEKLRTTMMEQEKWRPKLENHVKLSETLE